MSEKSNIEKVIKSHDRDAVGGEATYCIGCGSCAYLDPAFRIIRNEDGCNQATLAADIAEQKDCVSNIRPFACSVNENIIAKDLFANQSGVHHDEYLGYWLDCYVGYVNIDSWRSRGSSGGMVSWMAAKMLENDLVDAVIHVKDGPDSTQMYTYQISHTVEELAKGAKSKYYPIEMSNVLSYVREHEGRYLFIGIPCFVKAIRLLARTDAIIANRIKYCLGLVCGHLKSDFFEKSEAWEAGVPLNDIKRVDFRHKTPDSPASDYAVEILRKSGKPPVVKRTADLSTTNWGLGYFKYNACDYCDDVLSETADMTFGDAWLPEYVGDEEGCNIIIVRNQELQNILDKHKGELVLHQSDSAQIIQSQAAGFRHRRQGLSYRLYVHKKRGEWTPTKRVQPSLEGIPERRQNIYAMRTILKNQSFVGFRKAVESNDFHVFINWMKPYVKQYNKIRLPFKTRAKRLIKNAVKKLIPGSLIIHIKRYK